MFRPRHPDLQAGLQAQERREWRIAEACYRSAAAAEPVESRFMLGWLAFARQDWPAAQAEFAAVLTLDAAFCPAWVMLGNLALSTRRPADAVAAFAAARALNPAASGILLSLGQAHVQAREPAEALAVLQAFVRVHPEVRQAWELMAQAYGQRLWSLHQARCLERALALNPDEPRLLEHLSVIWGQLGYSQAQEQVLGRLLALTPANRRWQTGLPPAGRAYLADRRQAYAADRLLMHYADPEIDDTRLLEELRQLRPRRTLPAQPLPPLSGRLRIGYVSREFGSFASMQLCWPLFRYHSPEVELYAYDDTPAASPSTDLRPWFTHWRSLHGLGNKEAAACIQADHVDVLVDLAGLTHARRMGVFERRPAPVQVSGLGFVFSSGNASIDYCLSDAVLCPPQIAAGYCEQEVLLLPTAFHWRPPPAAPPPGAPPCLQNGYLTFGSANSLKKLHPRLFALWARLLRQLPTARLFLKTAVFNDPLTVRFYQELLAHYGIETARVRLEGQGEQPHMAYFYPQIDIALDAFPYQGGITSCEALWMGVPVVSLLAPQWRSRALSASILTTLGLKSWLATDEAGYLEQALAWAQDRDFLIAQRHSLRQRLLNSPICDGPGFAAEIEALFRQLRQRAAP